MCQGASPVLVLCKRRSAAGSKAVYIFLCCFSLLVTRQRVSASFSRALRRFFWAFFPRCIHNVRISVPSSASSFSKVVTRLRLWSKVAWSILSYTRSTRGCEYQERR